MKKNVGTVDMVIRFIVVLGLAALIVTGIISGVLAFILGVLAVFLLTSGLLRFCYLYTLLGISTRGPGAGKTCV